MYLKFSMDPYPNSVHEDHLKHKAPKINVQNSTKTQQSSPCFTCQLIDSTYDTPILARCFANTADGSGLVNMSATFSDVAT
jgi:hypothetical protein